jgi:hypothetical protein
MWLILCESNDHTAFWAAQGLRQRGLAPLEVVTAGQLANAQRWYHHLSEQKVETEIVLGDGRRIVSDRVRGVINRLQTIPSAVFERLDAVDQGYAWQELQALYLSWLHALPCVVLGRAAPLGLAGRVRHVSEWLTLAAAVGLPFAPYSLADDDLIRFSGQSVTQHAVVIAGRTYGPHVPPVFADGCQRLAARVGAEMLGIELAIDRDGACLFRGVSPLPDLMAGGAPLLDALADFFDPAPAPATVPAPVSMPAIWAEGVA